MTGPTTRPRGAAKGWERRADPQGPKAAGGGASGGAVYILLPEGAPWGGDRPQCAAEGVKNSLLIAPIVFKGLVLHASSLFFLLII